MTSLIGSAQISRLRRHAVSVFAFIVLALLALTTTLLAQQRENSIRVSGEEIDFGYIPFGATVKHTLYIVNDADTSLRITRVNPGCGCTSIPLEKRTAEPGDTLRIDILFDSGEVRRGKFQKAPRVFTDSRLRPQIVCKLTGISFDSLRAEFKNQDIIEVRPVAVEMPRNRESDSTRIVLKNISRLTLIPRLVEASDLLEVEVPPRAIIPGREMAIDVKVKDLSDVRVDAIRESITLAFNDPDRTRITIPVKVMK